MASISSSLRGRFIDERHGHGRRGHIHADRSEACCSTSNSHRPSWIQARRGWRRRGRIGPVLRANASLTKKLSEETLKRPYQELNLPGLCLHIAYLRESTVRDSNSARAYDSALFNYLQRELESSILLPGEENELHVPSEGDGEDSDGADVPGLGPRSLDSYFFFEIFGEQAIVRFQQFSEFSTYSFNMPLTKLVVQQEGGGEHCGSALRAGIRQGEALLKQLKSEHGGWWEKLPGDTFLTAVIASSPVSFEKEPGRRGELRGMDVESLKGAFPRDNKEEKKDSVDMECRVLAGAVLRDGRMGLVANYELTESDCMHVGVLFDESAGIEERKGFSRQIARFIEAEQYRLLCLRWTDLVKTVLEEMNFINESLVEILESLEEVDKERSPVKAKERCLRRLIELQTKCEKLAAETKSKISLCEAYGLVVSRRLKSLDCHRKSDFKSLEDFMRKRLDPALRTYYAVNKRIDETTQSVTRGASLLRTQVDIRVQSQNESLIAIGTILSFSSVALTLLQFLENLHVL